MTGPELRALFVELNQKFWRGRLPHYRVRLRKLSGMPSAWVDKKKRNIWMDSRPQRIEGGDYRQTLLHEMCHIPEGCDGHGALWRRQLRRLLEQGEEWADDELDEFKEQAEIEQEQRRPLSERRVRQFMRMCAESALTRGYERSFASVRRTLAKDYGLSLKTFTRRFPHADSWWLLAQQQELKRRRAQDTLGGKK